MILIVTFSQARTKSLKLKESEMLTNRSYGVHKCQVYYNQKKGSKNMNIFINAYIALYGGTKDNARRVWRATDKEYHDLIIESFKQNAHKAFYND